ncbi:Lrp/AsnC family transcriptional regulator [Paucibacter sp. B2R-40]|uniref:Lrp/AsnC family transcriptional regulator n=1 Tax=Paucibacter sp. B2R-40 TaxID=2893554 RepID=UPI0021E36894|nr:Lrp/AsnC family transcriptional regulator [Paucibacter sp. B2R-40]MCV2354665.1 Lrp/AsnC family transcriptional regulator [Paucibacter sp. B2R-40]
MATEYSGEPVAGLDELDRQLLELLRVNARLPVVKLAKALGCARSTVQLRLKALEDGGHITGYTISVAQSRARPGIRAMVLITVDSKLEPEVARELTRRHEIHKLYAVSGRFDLCAMLTTESTEELDTLLDRIRAIKGVVDTVSTILLSNKLDRPE